MRDLMIHYSPPASAAIIENNTEGVLDMGPVVPQDSLKRRSSSLRNLAASGSDEASATMRDRKYFIRERRSTRRRPLQKRIRTIQSDPDCSREVATTASLPKLLLPQPLWQPVDY